MKLLFLLAMPALMFTSPAIEAAQAHVVDSNVALYQGTRLNYVIGPPYRFRLVIDEAILDGYSLAFVDNSATYDSAAVLIAVSIFSLGDNSFADVLASDTESIREHYGAGLSIRPVDPVINAVGQPVTTFFIDDKRRFIPTVMVSYYDGGTEIVIFELSIAENYPRFVAEQAYVDCLSRFKVLTQGPPVSD